MITMVRHENGCEFRRPIGSGLLLLEALLAAGLALTLTSCTSTLVDSIAISPTEQSLSVGQTGQFTATGTIGHGSGHPATTEDVTDSVTWTSSSPSVATVNTTGLVTGVGAGTTTISATMPGFTGSVASTATVTVMGAGGTGANGAPVSLSIIPSAQSVTIPGQTAQFIAIGTTTSGGTVNLSNQVIWTSSSSTIATIGATTGLATAAGQGTATITALYTNGGAALTATATFTVEAGSTEKFTALTITPGSQSVSASGQTGQFIALATTGSTDLEEDVTNSPQIRWVSSIPTVATISSSGLVTGESQGTSAITAELTNPDDSIVSASAAITVTLTPAPEPLLSLTIIPSSITVGNLQDTGNFLAIGTFSTPPAVRDLTNSVTWISSFPDVFPVDTSNGVNTGTTGGIVTAYGNGGATIIAEATDPATGSIQTATATFNCPLVIPNPTGNPPTPGSCYQGSQAPALKATVTVYNEGLNNTGWLVTASSATGTPDVIHCGPGWALNGGAGGSVCAAPYPIGTAITLTAPAQAGVAFGGWSSSCTAISPNPSTAAGPNSCTFTITDTNTNISVGAIFN